MRSLEQTGNTFNSKWLTLQFSNAAGVPKNYSQCAQDLFVLSCLNGKIGGTFVELGCNEPYSISNSYLLESQFNWKGVSIDFDPQFEAMWKSTTRTSSMSTQDATLLDWDIISNTLGTTHIDYMSLDLEPASITLKALKNIPLDRISFSVITYEHDEYRFGDECKTRSRSMLQEAGYELVCGNVESFEDWWVNPNYVDTQKLSPLYSNYVPNGERHVMRGKV